MAYDLEEQEHLDEFYERAITFIEDHYFGTYWTLFVFHYNAQHDEKYVSLFTIVSLFLNF